MCRAGVGGWKVCAGKNTYKNTLWWELWKEEWMTEHWRNEGLLLKQMSGIVLDVNECWGEDRKNTIFC